MNASNDFWPSKDGLRLGHLNINHAINKLTDIASILSNSGNNFHIFGLSESRLSHVISDSDLIIPGYNIIRRDPRQPKETGLLIYVHDSITFKRLDHLEQHAVESVWIEVNLKRASPLLLGYCYIMHFCIVRIQTSQRLRVTHKEWLQT